MTNFYLYLRNGYGFAKSFYWAFDCTPRDFFLNAVLCLILVCLLVAAAIVGFGSVAEAKETQQRAFVQELENIVTKCTNRGDNTIVIDGEIWLCGAAPTGVKI